MPPAPSSRPAPALRRTRRSPERFVVLHASSLWTSGPLAALGDRERMLWLRLATGPEALSIPGVVVARAEEIAASLGWTVEDVAKISASIPGVHARIDWTAGIAWLPALLRSQPPRSPKNVEGWPAVWESLPASPILADIFAELAAHCATRGSGFARAFEAILPRESSAPALAPATIVIRGVHVTASGVSPADAAAVVREFAKAVGVPIEILQPAVAEPAPENPGPMALPALASFVGPPRRTGRRAGWQRVLDERPADVERVLAYQTERRAAAFELAEKAPTPIDTEKCRRSIAERLAEGRSVVECETVCDRSYERVGAESGAARALAARWWSHVVWEPARFGELLRLDVGAGAPTGVTALASAINRSTPAGATALQVLSDLRPLTRLLELATDAEILATATDFAVVIGEQNRQLQHRTLAEGEVRLAKVWGLRMFGAAQWSAIQTVVARFAEGDRSLEMFTDLSATLSAATVKLTAAAKPG